MEQIILRTAVLKPLKSHLVKRGSLYAILGGALLLGFGAFSPPLFLSRWGLLIWCSALFLIAWGLIPYKRVAKLEEIPNRLILDGEKLSYFKGEKLCRQVDRKSIVSADFIEVNPLYGISLKVDPETKEQLPEPSFMARVCLKKVKAAHDYDLFFPYFSKRSARELQEWLP